MTWVTSKLWEMSSSMTTSTIITKTPLVPLAPGDQHLFSENIQDIISKSITNKRTWLLTADIRVKCTQMLHDNLIQHIMTMHNYFDDA